MFRYKAKLLACWISALSVQWAHAEDEQIQEVIIWGTKVQSSSLKIDEDDVAIRQADHISDLLRTIPGVDVGGAHSMNQRITIRSMDDKDLRITIDGANQNTYMYHHMGNLQIHADILSEASISVGNNSVIDGGLGGAVRFKTKSAQDLLAPGSRLGARAQVGYASNAQNSLALTAYGQINENLDVLAYLNQVQRGDFSVGGGKIYNAEGEELTQFDGEVKGLKGDLQDALVKVGWAFNDEHRLSFGYEAYSDKGDYSYRPDMGLATDFAFYEAIGGALLWPTEFTRDTTTLNYEGTFGATELSAAVFKNQSNLYRDESGWLNSNWPEDAAIVEGEATNSGVNLMAASSDPKCTTQLNLNKV